MRTSWVTLLSVLAVMLSLSWTTQAAEACLSVTNEKETHCYEAATLLARKDVATLTVGHDVSYRRAMTYRAIPLLTLLGDVSNGPFDTLEARATDGFIAQIPLSLVAQGSRGGAKAWLAIEDPAHPWGPLPKGTGSARPFYVVWENPERSKVTSEQWPHWLVSLSLVESPVHRWPQLELPAAHSTDPAARAGQKVFFELCLPCHRLNGGGAGEAGPDLGQPMSATEYLTDAGLRGIIRDPRAVRSWPNLRMDGFGQKTLPDADLDRLLMYLRLMTPKVGQKN